MSSTPLSFDWDDLASLASSANPQLGLMAALVLACARVENLLKAQRVEGDFNRKVDLLGERCQAPKQVIHAAQDAWKTRNEVVHAAGKNYTEPPSTNRLEAAIRAMRNYCEACGDRSPRKRTQKAKSTLIGPEALGVRREYSVPVDAAARRVDMDPTGKFVALSGTRLQVFDSTGQHEILSPAKPGGFAFANVPGVGCAYRILFSNEEGRCMTRVRRWPSFRDLVEKRLDARVSTTPTGVSGSVTTQWYRNHVLVASADRLIGYSKSANFALPLEGRVVTYAVTSRDESQMLVGCQDGTLLHVNLNDKSHSIVGTLDAAVGGLIVINAPNGDYFRCWAQTKSQVAEVTSRHGQTEMKPHSLKGTEIVGAGCFQQAEFDVSGKEIVLLDRSGVLHRRVNRDWRPLMVFPDEGRIVSASFSANATSIAILRRGGSGTHLDRWTVEPRCAFAIALQSKDLPRDGE